MQPKQITDAEKAEWKDFYQHEVTRYKFVLDELFLEEEGLLSVEGGRGAETDLAVLTLAKSYFEKQLKYAEKELQGYAV